MSDVQVWLHHRASRCILPGADCAIPRLLGCRVQAASGVPSVSQCRLMTKLTQLGLSYGFNPNRLSNFSTFQIKVLRVPPALLQTLSQQQNRCSRPAAHVAWHWARSHLYHHVTNAGRSQGWRGLHTVARYQGSSCSASIPGRQICSIDVRT